MYTQLIPNESFGYARYMSQEQNNNGTFFYTLPNLFIENYLYCNNEMFFKKKHTC